MGSALESKQLVMEKFESIGLKLDDISTGEQQVVRVGTKLRTANIIIHLFFDEDGDSIHLSSELPIVVPVEKLAPALMAVNQANKQYRWVTFYLDTDDNTIMVNLDAVIEPTTAGDETLEVLMHTCSIVDNVYPELMKAIYG